MIKELKIKGLFEQFNYKITFKDDGITIITGPNGYGKSTILRIIDALANESLYELVQFPFSELLVVLDDDEMLIKKHKNSITIDGCLLEIIPRQFLETWIAVY